MPDKKLTDEQMLAQLANRLMEEKGVGGLDNGSRSLLRQGLVVQMNEELETGMIQALSTEQLRQLSELLSKEADDAEVEQFFEATGIDFQAVTEQVLAGFRTRYLTTGDDGAIIKMMQKRRAESYMQMPEGQGSPFAIPQNMTMTTAEMN